MSNVETPEIQWGFNCLTVGIHHGRPEAIWNLPLIHANTIFGTEQLKRIVVARVFNDARQFVEHGNEPRMPKEWADRVKVLADEMYDQTLESKLDELFKYYASSSWKRDLDYVVEKVESNELNPFYEPLHTHDTVNLLCRIIGTQCSRRAAAEFGR